jgi:hypothetical protein
MKTRVLVIIGFTGLLAVALFAAGMLTGSGLAQGTGGSTDGDDSPGEKNVVVKEIEIDGGAGGGTGFPFESALRTMAENGELATADVDAIMSDLSQATDAVNYESSTSADGVQEVLVDITIRSDEIDSLRAAMEQVLDAAVAVGRLTAAQRDQVLVEVDAAPEPGSVPAGGVVHVRTLAMDDEFATAVEGRLDEALAAGKVSADEAAIFMDILERLLAE